MKHDDTNEMRALEKLLKDAADTPPDLPPGLASRVLFDARQFQPKSKPIAVLRPTMVQRFADALGGWPGMGGLVAATCAGFWIGIASPSGLPDAAEMISQSADTSIFEDTIEMSRFGWDLGEGL